MAFKDPAELDRGLELPIAGVTYKIPPLSAEIGPRAQAIYDAVIRKAKGGVLSKDDEEILDDDGERDLYRKVLGDDIFVDMCAAPGVAWVDVKRAAHTVLTDACISRSAAEAYWNDELGKAPNRAAKRAAAREGTATSTRRAGSTAGTTAPRTAAKKAASRGSRSSRTGS